MGVTLTALVGAGLLGGLGLVVVGARTPRPAMGRRLGGLLALLMCAVCTVIAFSEGPSYEPHVNWFGQVESVRLGSSGIGGQLAAMAWGALGLCLLRSSSSGQLAGSRLWPGVAHLLCGLVVAALTVDQFLARLVLLDLISLGTALVVGWDPERRDESGFIRSYLMLRAGDMALLAMVLLLYAQAGTFQIDSMIDVAIRMPPGLRLVAGSIGVLAAWVKLGLPPAHRWAEAGLARRPGSARWLLIAGLPLLGAYLLYRVRPVLAAAGVAPMISLAGVAMLAACSVWWLERARGRSSPATLGYIAHAALGLVLLPAPAYRVYLLSFVPARVAIGLLRDPGPELAGAMDAWGDRQVSLGWLKHLSAYVVRLDRRVLQGAERGLVSFIGRLATGCVERVEPGLNRLVDRAASFAAAASGALTRQHTGRLRLNLRWVAAVLLLILLASVVWPLV